MSKEEYHINLSLQRVLLTRILLLLYCFYSVPCTGFRQPAKKDIPRDMLISDPKKSSFLHSVSCSLSSL